MEMVKMMLRNYSKLMEKKQQRRVQERNLWDHKLRDSTKSKGKSMVASQTHGTASSMSQIPSNMIMMQLTSKATALQLTVAILRTS
uniref:Uncharacterized protein n=1 Tax=Romanomermis culicivorax TaxID=13658 RepID=A0A915KQL9_ROMCU